MTTPIKVKHKVCQWLEIGGLALAGIPIIISIILHIFTGYHPWYHKLSIFNDVWFLLILLIIFIINRKYYRGLIYEIRVYDDRIAFTAIPNSNYYCYLNDVKMEEDDEKIYFKDDRKLNVYLFKKDLKEGDYERLKEAMQKEA